MKYCINCGHELKENADYCIGCGKLVIKPKNYEIHKMPSWAITLIVLGAVGSIIFVILYFFICVVAALL